MNPTETLEKLRSLDRQIIHGPRDFGEMADAVEGMIKALAPFADAAAKVDVQSDEQLRLVGSRISEDASPGWGIRRKHLNAAREILGRNN